MNFVLLLILMLLLAWVGAHEFVYGNYHRALLFGWAALFILFSLATSRLGSAAKHRTSDIEHRTSYAQSPVTARPGEVVSRSRNVPAQIPLSTLRAPFQSTY